MQLYLPPQTLTRASLPDSSMSPWSEPLSPEPLCAASPSAPPAVLCHPSTLSRKKTQRAWPFPHLPFIGLSQQAGSGPFTCLRHLPYRFRKAPSFCEGPEPTQVLEAQVESPTRRLGQKKETDRLEKQGSSMKGTDLEGKLRSSSVF